MCTLHPDHSYSALALARIEATPELRSHKRELYDFWLHIQGREVIYRLVAFAPVDELLAWLANAHEVGKPADQLMLALRTNRLGQPIVVAVTARD
jgi:hypothetical protein